MVTAGPDLRRTDQWKLPNDQVLSLNIGGPNKNVDVALNGSLGPIVVSLADQLIEAFPYSYQEQCRSRSSDHR